MFGNLTAGYIVTGIENKISEYENMSQEDLDKQGISKSQNSLIIQGLREAKEIAIQYED